MSVNPTEPTKQKETNHSTTELRFLKLETGFRKHEELLKSHINLFKQVIIFS